MEIYLIRHGETDWNKEFRFQGRTDIPLNEYGRELARLTSDALRDVPFDAAFCSPLQRAVETAQIILRDRNVPLIRDERLTEISFGIREGCDFREAGDDPSDPIYDFLKRPAQYRPPEGAESLDDIRRRSAEFLDEIILPLEGRCKTVLIVAHGALNRSILNAVSGIGPEDFWSIRLPNCAVSRIRLSDGTFRIVDPSAIYY